MKTRVTIKWTVEELFKDGDDTMSADADIQVTYDLYPEEPMTRDYPGCPSSAELVGWSIDHYTLYDDDTGLVIAEGPQDRTPDWIKREIDGWVSSNDRLLIDMCCEQEHDADEAAREAYWDSKREDY